MRTVYCDHAATTPVHPEVAAAATEAMMKGWGNPSSTHAAGRAARRALEQARRQVAALLGAEPYDVIFTSGGTEADNLAVRGGARAAVEAGRGRHVVTSLIEHHAVLDACRSLESEGWRVSWVAPDRRGRVDPAAVAAVLRPDTALVSLMLANNEVGTVQPVVEVAALARACGALMHTDAVQAAGQLPLDVQALGVDLLSVSAHKIYGPKGVGALYVRPGTPLSPLVHGGSQERRWRPGTENVPGIVGFGVAARLAAEEREVRAAHLARRRDRLAGAVARSVPSAQATGDPAHRLPAIASFVLPGVDGEALLVALDLAGVAASSGSACTSGSVLPSHVLTAMGYPADVGQSALRLSVGVSTTEDDVDYVAEAVAGAVARQSAAAART